MKADWCQLLVSGKNEGGPFSAKMWRKRASLLLRPSGFEPLTYRLEGGRSIQLSYGRFIILKTGYFALFGSGLLSRRHLKRETHGSSIGHKTSETVSRISAFRTPEWTVVQKDQGKTMVLWCLGRFQRRSVEVSR